MENKLRRNGMMDRNGKMTIDETPPKKVIKVFINKIGRRVKKIFNRNAFMSDKSELQRKHFGNFSPCKPFKY